MNTDSWQLWQWCDR